MWPRITGADIQVWHLHLVYTKSYWEDLCERTLGFPLHHGPTRGGDKEAKKYHAQYAATLFGYRQVFGAEPPADIWPTSKQRFQSAAFRRVDGATHWIIPKPGKKGILLGGLLSSLSGCAWLQGNASDSKLLGFLTQYQLESINQE